MQSQSSPNKPLRPVPCRFPTLQHIALLLTLSLASCLGSRTTGIQDLAEQNGAAQQIDAPQNGAKKEPIFIGLSGLSACKSKKMPPQQLRRLTDTEFSASIAAVFGDKDVKVDKAFIDQHAYVFTNNATINQISDGEFIQLWMALGGLAEQLSAKPTFFVNYGSCAQPDDVCSDKLISKITTSAYRRQPTMEELADIKKIYTLAGGSASFAKSMAAAVKAIFVSPYFLYRSEIGTPDPKDTYITHLTQDEIASALSYLVAGQPPDAMLLAAAAKNTLTDPNERLAHAERLLKALPPNKKAPLVDMWMQLFDFENLADKISKDTAVYNTYNVAVGQAMERHAQEFFTAAAQKNIPFSELFAAAHPALPGDLTTALKSEVPTDTRAGLLTLPAFLARYGDPAQSSPTHRGKAIRQRLQCLQMLPPPPSVDPSQLPGTPKNDSSRAKAELYLSVSPCKECHKSLDPIGFGLESFDSIGRLRTTDNKAPVDDSGHLLHEDGSMTPFKGAGELSLILGSAQVAQECFVRMMMVYNFGQLGWSEDGCTFDAIAPQAKASNYQVLDVLHALLKSEAFIKRSPNSEEIPQ